MRIRRYFIVVCCLLLATAGLYAQEDQAIHIVQPGENLYQIALRHGVSMDELAQANNITNQNRIFRGQELVIPGLTSPDAGDEVTNPLIAGIPTIHVVQPGETVMLIAQQYGITPEQLLQANNIVNANVIYRGQQLTIWTPETVDQTETTTAELEALPDEFTAVAPPETNIAYVVQPGEGLAQIAQRYGVAWQTLARINGIVDPNRINAGQELMIPAVNADGGVVDMGILAPQGPGATIAEGKQIVVDLSEQMTYAYEDGLLVYSALSSTGLPATPTVTGEFTIYHRLDSQTMSGPGYYLPGVQSVQYFYQGYALHGTYWHDDFGQPMSHGCVNLTNQDAAWFYEFGDIGTSVRVQY